MGAPSRWKNCMEESRPSSQYSRAMVHKWLATVRKLDIGG